MKRSHCMRAELASLASYQQTLATILILLIFMQNFNTLQCHDIVLNDYERNDALAAYDKRATLATGQPEEIFTNIEAVEANYDEYPMVVPKRAALLLDRLMLALHRAMEKERNSHRIAQMYSKNNINNNNNKNQIDDDTEVEKQNMDDTATPLYQMYSDDDPNVITDYDFKDLNSINRATGESLMAKSFQRRANMGVNGVALLTAGTTAAADEAAGVISAATGGVGVGGGGGGGGRSTGGGGRIYWRCYFNAVSCF